MIDLSNKDTQIGDPLFVVCEAIRNSSSNKKSKEEFAFNVYEESKPLHIEDIKEYQLTNCALKHPIFIKLYYKTTDTFYKTCLIRLFDGEDFSLMQCSQLVFETSKSDAFALFEFTIPFPFTKFKLTFDRYEKAKIMIPEYI